MQTLAAAEYPLLSKSRYVAGLQCHLRVWYDRHRPELREAPSEELQAIFDQGHAVGGLATQLFPGGVLVAEDHTRGHEARELTQQLMSRGDVPAVFEAAFVHGGTQVRIDALRRRPGERWDIIEVKSTASVKQTHLDDVAVQYWVAKGAGVKVSRAYVCTLNTAYVFDGVQLDLQRLFSLHDVTKEVRARQPGITPGVRDMIGVLQSVHPPAVSPGAHCDSPYECPYIAHCRRGLEPVLNPLEDLPNLSAKKASRLRELGVTTVEGLDGTPEEFRLSQLQARVRDCVRTGTEYVGPGLEGALAEPAYPIHHLDFEAFNPAIPRYADTSPYQALPFQWSNHIENRDGHVRHEGYLSAQDRDPREELAVALLRSVGRVGTICSYSPYERQVISGLAHHLPKYARRLRALLPRLWDLLPIIRRHYYHPNFHGSFSIKTVLPVLVPSLSYDGLEVADGIQAGRAYLEAITTSDPARKGRLLGALRAYCAQDTMAMVELRRALWHRVQG